MNRLFFKYFEKNLIELKMKCVKDEEPLEEEKPLLAIEPKPQEKPQSPAKIIAE